jgi:hypothetical protein
MEKEHASAPCNDGLEVTDSRSDRDMNNEIDGKNLDGIAIDVC